MQITLFTDIGLKVLMYLAVAERDDRVTITEIAERFQLSRHHLVKVVHRLGQLNLIATTRGKGGGLALSRPAQDYRLGDLVQALEDHRSLIDCSAPPCVLNRSCKLKHALDDGLRAFYDKLNESTLADTLDARTTSAIVKLHRSIPSVPQADDVSDQAATETTP